jgi:Holliday junction resolvase RusA-like endonuclease
MLHFRVYGIAQTKGSMRAFIPKGWTRPVLTNDNPKNKGWQLLIAEGASRAIQDRPASERGLLAGGVRLTVAFYLPRPKKFMRPGMHPAHLTRPDLDKCARSVADALHGIAWHDDSQVVDLVVMKRYVRIDEAPHADIWVEPSAGVEILARAQPLFEAVR